MNVCFVTYNFSPKKGKINLFHADIKTPRNFNLKSRNDETHDFAMAILEREITFTDSVRPICIPRQVRMLEAVFKGGIANWVKAATKKTEIRHLNGTLINTSVKNCRTWSSVAAKQ